MKYDGCIHYGSQFYKPEEKREERREDRREERDFLFSPLYMRLRRHMHRPWRVY